MKCRNVTVTVVLLVGLCVAGSRARLINGSVYAYDPIMHLVRHTYAENIDVIILKVSQGDRDKYLKVVIRSLGQTLPEASFHDGRTIRFSVVRDKKCDEPTPDFVTKGSAPTESGHYVLSSAYEKQPTVKVSDMPCYVARIKVP